MTLIGNAQVLADFKQLLRDDYGAMIGDRIACRELLNNYTDALCKDGLITIQQYETIISP